MDATAHNRNFCFLSSFPLLFFEKNLLFQNSMSCKFVFSYFRYALHNKTQAGRYTSLFCVTLKSFSVTGVKMRELSKIDPIDNFQSLLFTKYVKLQLLSNPGYMEGTKRQWIYLFFFISSLLYTLLREEPRRKIRNWVEIKSDPRLINS